MTDNTRDMLYKNMLGIRETIEAYALQILSGDYGGADEQLRARHQQIHARGC
jgi:hypothetical protein